MALYRKIDPGQQHRGRRALRRSTQLTHTHYTCACAISEHRCVASHSRHRRKQQVSFFLPLSHLLSFVVVFNICHSNHRESVCPVCLPTYLTNLLSERAHTHTRLARFLLFELIEFSFVQFFNGPLFVCVCVPLLLLLVFFYTLLCIYVAVGQTNNSLSTTVPALYTMRHHHQHPPASAMLLYALHFFIFCIIYFFVYFVVVHSIRSRTHVRWICCWWNAKCRVNVIGAAGLPHRWTNPIEHFIHIHYTIHT